MALSKTQEAEMLLLLLEVGVGVGWGSSIHCICTLQTDKLQVKEIQAKKFNLLWARPICQTL